jgi:hypothetical protein
MPDANDVPSIPVPPVEPAPAAVIPPIVDLTGGSAASAQEPNPYAPAAPVNPYAQQAPTYQPQPYGYPGYAPTPPNGLAITSMILGIAGLFLGLLLSVGAVITGHIAQRKQPYARGFWLTGLITGYIGIGLWTLVILIYIIFVVVAIGASASYGSSYYN